MRHNLHRSLGHRRSSPNRVCRADARRCPSAAALLPGAPVLSAEAPVDLEEPTLGSRPIENDGLGLRLFDFVLAVGVAVAFAVAGLMKS